MKSQININTFDLNGQNLVDIILLYHVIGKLYPHPEAGKQINFTEYKMISVKS